MLFLLRVLIPTYLFIIKIINSSQVDLAKSNNSVCLTAGCVRFAADILSSINLSVNPCDDFYGYVCGNVIPKKTLSYFVVGTEKRNEFLQSALDEFVVEGNRKPYVEFYKSCKNTTTINERGLKPLEMFLQKFGGWPALSSKNTPEKPWSSLLIDMWNSGITANYILQIDKYFDKYQLTNPAFILRTEILSNGISNKRVKEYFDFMINIAVTLGGDYNEVKEELQNSLDFEIQLANIVPLSKVQLSSIDLTWSEINLESKAKNVPWTDLIKTMLPHHIAKYENITFLLEDPNFFNKLNILMTKTSNKIIINYLIWRTIYESIDLLPQNLQLQKFNFEQKTTFDRSKYCFEVTLNKFNLNMASLYARQVDSKSNLNIANKITDNIHEQFVKILKENSWMDSESKPKALKKIQNMNKLIGYPEELLNDSNIDIYYNKLQFDSHNFFESYYKVNYYVKNLNLKDWTDFGIFSNEINAQYYFETNGIGIPVAFIMAVMPYNNLPMYVNYGALGTVIGHEMTHGFDINSIDRDACGNKHEWLTPKSREEFLNRIECLVEQYNNFTEPLSQIKLNGSYTCAENTADVVGFKLAELAYDQWTKENHIEGSLPGFENMTPKQLFWVTIAYDFCDHKTKDDSIDTIRMDVHSPFRFRINGAAQDSETFAKEFNCPMNAPMNPIKKCEIY